MGFIWNLTCQECGEELEYLASMDSDGDIKIRVELCTDCIEDARVAGYDERKEEEE